MLVGQKAALLMYAMSELGVPGLYLADAHLLQTTSKITNLVGRSIRVEAMFANSVGVTHHKSDCKCGAHAKEEIRQESSDWLGSLVDNTRCQSMLSDVLEHWPDEEDEEEIPLNLAPVGSERGALTEEQVIRLLLTHTDQIRKDSERVRRLAKEAEEEEISAD